VLACPWCAVGGCQLELEHVRHRLKEVLQGQQEKAQVGWICRDLWGLHTGGFHHALSPVQATPR
jgi:hypothetical protein